MASFGSKARLFPFQTVSKGFCTATSANCPESISIQKVPGWEIQFFVKNVKDSEVLQQFTQIPLPKFEQNLQESIIDCQSRSYKFPGFPKKLGENDLARQDETKDSFFYETPRFVTHIDDWAIESLMDYYDVILNNGMTIVDLCSSWISHLPRKFEFEKVIGVGMNEQELAANKNLDTYFIHDLNKEPDLSMIPDNSVDAVLCTVSVDYLNRPFEVFAEVHRILKPGAGFIVSFSNRMFATKAVRAWLMTEDPIHLYMVGVYFQISAKWQKVIVSDVSQRHPTLPRDPLYILHGIK